MNGTADSATTGSNSLLIKTIIDDALANNLSFDFEGSMIRQVEAFYRLFGAERVAYHHIWNPTVTNTIKRAGVRWARKLAGYER
jgi:hypothetical protein